MKRKIVDYLNSVEINLILYLAIIRYLLERTIELKRLDGSFYRKKVIVKSIT